MARKKYKKPNREIDESIEQGVIMERLGNLISTNDRDHKVIIEQVKKTNGTVNVHTNRIVALERWRSLITGGMIVANAIIVPVLIWLVSEYLKGG